MIDLNDFTNVECLFEDDDDRLANYFRIAETVADLIGPHCEVVVHSLKNLETSVAKIVNGHMTGRTIGSPITDLGLKMLRVYQETGNLTPKAYFTHNAEGQLLKSATTIILGASGKPIGLFCLNINLSLPFSEIISTFTPDAAEVAEKITPERFSTNSTEVILGALEQAIKDVEADPSVTQKAKNKAVTRLLLERDIFEFKEATVLVAENLGITRHAIYKYIRESKTQITSKE
ncbi:MULTISPECIES: PAS domain-containing protein [unclassified Pseudovibrio]|uniref:helix-turn-helix transcriptional regulator n=1 Tax=unclassified Pseudovibrio TaxID=2627060 RepID=UPI0007AE4D77|nr:MULTISPECIES: PAS domain-containing protein [unclassified Pseudovibrio]